MINDLHGPLGWRRRRERVCKRAVWDKPIPIATERNARARADRRSHQRMWPDNELDL
jgi:hypothetical protein